MMFGEHSKTQFIEQTRAARIERANDRKREQSAILIQSLVRGWLVRKRTRNLILYVRQYPLWNSGIIIHLPFTKKNFIFIYRHQFDKTFENIDDLKPAINVYLTVKKLLSNLDEKRDRHRFEKLCRYIISLPITIIMRYVFLTIFFHFFFPYCT